MRGYTLIEVIISLAIFAILSTLSVGVLSRAFDTKAKLQAQLEPLSELELAIARITLDTAQIVPRTVRTNDMTLLPAFSVGKKHIEFTRGGFIPVDKNASESTLRRVGLMCENHQLIRSTWAKLDGLSHDTPKQQVLLNHLKSCNFSFVSAERRWTDVWRETKKHPLPTAFKLHLVLDDLGEVGLVFQLPAGGAPHE